MYLLKTPRRLQIFRQVYVAPISWQCLLLKTSSLPITNYSKATDDSNSGITEIRTEYKRLVLNFNAFHFRSKREKFLKRAKSGYNAKVSWKWSVRPNLRMVDGGMK